MIIETKTFVDWRPISSIPINNEVLSKSDWVDFTDNFEANSKDYLGEWSDLEISYRFICRNDGIIFFQVKAPVMHGRPLVSLASKIVYEIKQRTKHFHVYDNTRWNISGANLTTYPVLCEDKTFRDFDGFVSFGMKNSTLKQLQAYSIAQDAVTDRKALLTIKKLYSCLFDRVCKRAAEPDDFVSAFSQKANTPLWRKYTAASLLVTVFILPALIFANFKMQLGKEWNIIITYSFLLFSGVVLLHVRHNINYVLVSRIRLFRKLIGYYSHGNNLSRALWRIYETSDATPSNDYDPIITIANDAINSTIRRINTYEFFFTAVVALIGIAITILL